MNFIEAVELMKTGKCCSNDYNEFYYYKIINEKHLRNGKIKEDEYILKLTYKTSSEMHYESKYIGLKEVLADWQEYFPEKKEKTIWEVVKTLFGQGK